MVRVLQLSVNVLASANENQAQKTVLLQRLGSRLFRKRGAVLFGVIPLKNCAFSGVRHVIFANRLVDNKNARHFNASTAIVSPTGVKIASDAGNFNV
jgi:hypothetical protein